MPRTGEAEQADLLRRVREIQAANADAAAARAAANTVVDTAGRILIRVSIAGELIFYSPEAGAGEDEIVAEMKRRRKVPLICKP